MMETTTAKMPSRAMSCSSSSSSSQTLSSVVDCGKSTPTEKGKFLLCLSHRCDNDGSQMRRLSNRRRRTRTSRAGSCLSSQTIVAFFVTFACFWTATRNSSSSFGCVDASSSSSSAVDSSSSGGDDDGDDGEKFSTLFRHLLSLSLCVFGLMTVYFHQYAASAFIRQYFDDTKTTTVKGRVVCCQSLIKTSSNAAPSHHHHHGLPTKQTANTTTTAYDRHAHATADVETTDVHNDNQNFSHTHNDDDHQMLDSRSGTALSPPPAAAAADDDYDRHVRNVLDPVTTGRPHHECVPNSFSASSAAPAAAAAAAKKVHNINFMMDVSALSVNSATDSSQYYDQEYLEMTDSNTAERSPSSFETSFDGSHDGGRGGSSSRPSSRRVRRYRQTLQRFLLKNNNGRHEQEEHNTSSNSNGNIYVHHSNKKYRVFVLYHVPIPTKNQHHNILCGGGGGGVPTTAASAVSSCCKQPTDAILDMYHTGPTGGGGISATAMKDPSTTTAPSVKPSDSHQISSMNNKVVEYQQIYLSDHYHPVNSWVDLIMLKDFPTSACTREVLQEQLLHIEKNSSPTTTTKSSTCRKMMKCGTVKIVTACSIVGFIVLLAFSLSEVSGLSTENGDRSKGYYMVSTAVVGSIIASYMICKALNEHYIRRAFLSAVPSPVQPTSTSSFSSSSTSQPWHSYHHPQLVHHQRRLQQQLQDQHQQEHLQYHELRKMVDGGEGQGHDQTMDDSMMTNATPLPPSSTGMFQHRPPAPPNPTRPFVSLTTGSSSKKTATTSNGSFSTTTTINAPRDFSGSGTSTSTEKFSNVQQSFVRRSNDQLMFPPVEGVDDGNLDNGNNPGLSNDGVTVPAG